MLEMHAVRRGLLLSDKGLQGGWEQLLPTCPGMALAMEQRCPSGCPSHCQSLTPSQRSQHAAADRPRPAHSHQECSISVFPPSIISTSPLREQGGHDPPSAEMLLTTH